MYQNVGGHAYGWVYPGPMGSVLTPTYVGLENALDLPHASTLCNQCGVVCPVKIPLPDLLRKLREQQFARGLRPWSERAGLAVWGWTARQPRVYALLSSVGARVLSWLGGADKRIRDLPGAKAGRSDATCLHPKAKLFVIYMPRDALGESQIGRHLQATDVGRH